MGDLKERKDLSEMEMRMLIFAQTFQAIEFLKKQAADYNLDAERIVVAGSSAGAGISNYLTYVKKAGITACVAIQQASGASHYAQFIEKNSPTLILYTSSGPEDKVHNPSNARLLKDHCDRVDSPCFLFGSPKSGLPAVPDGKRFVWHAMSLIDPIWSSNQE
jgi:predicted esterase